MYEPCRGEREGLNASTCNGHSCERPRRRSRVGTQLAIAVWPPAEYSCCQPEGARVMVIRSVPTLERLSRLLSEIALTSPDRSAYRKALLEELDRAVGFDLA